MDGWEYASVSDGRPHEQEDRTHIVQLQLESRGWNLEAGSDKRFAMAVDTGQENEGGS